MCRSTEKKKKLSKAEKEKQAAAAEAKQKDRAAAEAEWSKKLPGPAYYVLTQEEMKSLDYPLRQACCTS